MDKSFSQFKASQMTSKVDSANITTLHAITATLRVTM